ncbi:MAG: hypothetical protein HWN66_15555, partial [Candidatus Helarchaeota archaeon]|nr:hypothetical protein [Candidatus Helarchaeota archaeon]
GKGTHVYGSIYVNDREYSMDWIYSDHTVDIDAFSANSYNSQNFLLSEQPITSDYMLIEGSTYMHHRIDLLDSNNIIYPQGAEFAVIIPNSTDRIDSVVIDHVDQISDPWDWVESWQGFSFTEQDFNEVLGYYDQLNMETFNSSTNILTPDDYELVVNDNNEYQVNFFDSVGNIRSRLSSDIIQVDFHVSLEFTEKDFNIVEDQNTYNAELHWKFPDEYGYSSWLHHAYHPDLTSTTSFNASFSHFSEYAAKQDFNSTMTEEFQFYPNEYNFTTFEFTGFEGPIYSVTLNLTHGGDFQERWGDVLPFGMTVQTDSGELYLSDSYFANWQHSSDPAHQNKSIFTFGMKKKYLDAVGILEDSEILVTYYYRKESLSYYAERDDILFSPDYTFIIKDSNGGTIDIGNISSVVDNNITFAESITDAQCLSIGEKFTIQYNFKTRGGLVESKHVFVEVQPREMRFYNGYYPFSGGSIIAPLYYNFSANYQYQLAMNYRLQEKSLYSFEFSINSTDVLEFNLDAVDPMKDIDDSAVVVAYYYDEIQNKTFVDDDDLSYDYQTGNLTVDLSGYDVPLGDQVEDVLYVNLFAELHNKYKYYHDFSINLINNEIQLFNWSLAEAPEDLLVPNLESASFIHDIQPDNRVASGKVKQVYAILNASNKMIYHLEEDLNDPVNGWDSYDTLIMKLGILNSDVLEKLKVDFIYTDSGDQLIGTTYVEVDDIDETGEVHLRLPESEDLDQFTVNNKARIEFTPIFYDHSDFGGYYYEKGFPTFQLVYWTSEDVENNKLKVPLDKDIFSINQSVLVFNEMMEYVYEITEVGVTTVSEDSIEFEFHNISLPTTYTDVNGNTMIMRDGELLFLKYNASLEKAIGLIVEEMVLQKGSYIKNYETGQNVVPIAEISLLGIYNDENTYTIEDDLFGNRDKMVAWETSLDLTPFEDDFYNTYKQQVFNISFDDIYSGFKVNDSGNVEHCYITDVLITSNDPRYQLVVDSFFIFEFDSNATLYDSEIFDIYANNHITFFYIGDYIDIYEEYIIFNASEFFPLYYNNSTINETLYWDVFDSAGNKYYFNEHLFGESISTGVYNITWNPYYSEEYYYRYYDSQTEDELEYLKQLYDYYNPHVDKFRYLYISWADENAWKEWHTIDQVNVDPDSLDIVFEYYNETLEEYRSVTYNQTLNEFETRQVAVETLYPYDKSVSTATFNLSQDYGDAQDLDVLLVKGYFFNESELDFDPTNAVILLDDKSINVTAPSGFKLDAFEKIVVFLNFTGGAFSDYTQFRLLGNATSNHPNAPKWTKNDSLYVDFEYNDIDYFLLMEEYAVGSDDSLFEHLDYIRNDKYVSLEYGIYNFTAKEQSQNFELFAKVNDPKTALELYDFNLDSNHELVLQKDDLTGDGSYNSFKYGFVNPAGEISFHTLEQEVSSTNVETEKDQDVKISEGYQLDWKDFFRYHYIFAKRAIYTQTTTKRRTDTYSRLIQRDFDSDGVVDDEVMLSVTYLSVNVITFTIERTIFDLEGTIWNKGCDGHHGTFIEFKNASTYYYDFSVSFTFRDFISNEEVNSTRYYDDIFPNELSEVNNLENYLAPATNDLDDEDPSNDLTVQAPVLESLLSLSHQRDGIPAVFDRKITNVDGDVEVENILTASKVLSIPGQINSETGIAGEITSNSITSEVIEVKPANGVYYNNKMKYGPTRLLGGSYYYFDGNGDGLFETIFISDSNGEIIGFGFDNDQDCYFIPGSVHLVEKHAIANVTSEWTNDDCAHSPNMLKFIARDRKFRLGTYKHEEGYYAEPVYGDSLFDTWKMVFSWGSSRLIEEAESMRASQFIESLTAKKVWDDVMWQVSAVVISTSASNLIAIGVTLLSNKAYGEVARWVSRVVLYAVISSIHAWSEKRDVDYFIAAHTFHNPNYAGPITLSEKIRRDRDWGGSFWDTMWHSECGIYAPLEIDAGRFSYKGQVVLAPSDIDKTGRRYLPFPLPSPGFGEWYRDIKMDYSLQTRGYLAYSSLGLISPLFDPDCQHEYKYRKNSIMYLEDAFGISTASSDNHRDRIFPYMAYGRGTAVPSLQLGNSENPYLPEFYEDYPIFVSPDKYDELSDEYHVTFKIFNGSSFDIQLFPSSSSHSFFSDVVSLDAYFMDTLGCYVDFGTYDNEYFEIFSVNNATNIMTLNPAIAGYWNNMIADKKAANAAVPDYEAFIVLKIRIEKYRSIEDTRGLSEEEVLRIATMQSVQATFLHYLYQYSIASQTQSQLNEIAYTAFITASSCFILYAMGGGKMAFHSIGKEVLEEIFVDPIIETVSRKIGTKLGLEGYWLIFFSSLCESGREVFGSSFNRQFGSISIDMMHDLKIRAALDSNVDSRIKVRDPAVDLKQSASESMSRLLKARGFASASLLFTLSMFTGNFLGVTSSTLMGGSQAFGLMVSHKIAENIEKALLKKALKQYTFRKVGAPVDKAVHKIKVDPNQRVSLIIDQLVKDLDLSDLLEYKLVNGKVLDKSRTLLENNVNPREVLKIIAVQEGSAPINRLDIIKKYKGNRQIDLQRVLGKFVDPDSPDIYLLPMKDLVTSEDYDQDALKRIWKLGKFNGKYVFGMVYRWTNTKSGDFGYDLIMRKVGRTEQLKGSPKYRPVSSISVRFQGYLDGAIKTDLQYLTERTIEYDMRVVYDEAGGGDNGIRAILDSFELEILEIMFISDNYLQDCKIIEHLEDFYIWASDSKRPRGYNEAGGSAGPHVRESRSAHATVRLHATMDHLISHGFTMGEVAFYLRITVAQLDAHVRMAHNGKTFSVVQDELIENKMFDLIDEGYLTPGELGPYFNGFGPNGIFAQLARTERGKSYLKSLITSLISQHGFETYDPLLRELGMRRTRLGLQPPLRLTEIISEMGGLKNLKLEKYLKPLAKRMIKDSKDAHDLLIKIGWDIPPSLNYRRVDGSLNARGMRLAKDRILQLFGVTYEDAKNKHSTGYLGNV